MRSAPNCVCGHQKEAHEHYRAGSDCGVCGAAVCPKYRKAPVPRGGTGPVGGSSAPEGATDDASHRARRVTVV